MDAECFAVEDVVRIREWDDMLEEYGGNDRNIDCTCCFTAPMRVSCGAQCTINSIFDEVVRLTFYDAAIGDKMRGHVFSTDMIEPVVDESSFAESQSRVIDFLSGM